MNTVQASPSELYFVLQTGALLMNEKPHFFRPVKTPLLMVTGMVTITLLLGGCATPAGPASSVGRSARNAPVVPLRASPDEGPAMPAHCARELEALKLVNPADYTRRRAAFTQLMTAADQYGRVRSAVGDDTRGAVDALYEYRTSRMCADIAQALLTALAERGENHP